MPRRVEKSRDPEKQAIKGSQALEGKHVET
jgi:hypothetical protein